jgi:hypothetical protein
VTVVFGVVEAELVAGGVRDEARAEFGVFDLTGFSIVLLFDSLFVSFFISEFEDSFSVVSVEILIDSFGIVSLTVSFSVCGRFPSLFSDFISILFSFKTVSFSSFFT